MSVRAKKNNKKQILWMISTGPSLTPQRGMNKGLAAVIKLVNASYVYQTRVEMPICSSMGYGACSLPQEQAYPHLNFSVRIIMWPVH